MPRCPGKCDLKLQTPQGGAQWEVCVGLSKPRQLFSYFNWYVFSQQLFDVICTNLEVIWSYDFAMNPVESPSHCRSNLRHCSETSAGRPGQDRRLLPGRGPQQCMARSCGKSFTSKTLRAAREVGTVQGGAMDGAIGFWDWLANILLLLSYYCIAVYCKCMAMCVCVYMCMIVFLFLLASILFAMLKLQYIYIYNILYIYIHVNVYVLLAVF